MKKVLSSPETPLYSTKKTYYYNKKEDYTIIEYGAKSALLFSTFHIIYSEKNFCQ